MDDVRPPRYSSHRQHGLYASRPVARGVSSTGRSIDVKHVGVAQNRSESTQAEGFKVISGAVQLSPVSRQTNQNNNPVTSHIPSTVAVDNLGQLKQKPEPRTFEPPKKERFKIKLNFRRHLMAPSIALAVVLLAYFVYFHLIPSRIVSSYKSTMTSAYDKQMNQIDTIYSLAAKPLSSGGESSEINSAIKSADNLTGELESKNHFLILPETSRQYSVRTALVEQSAIKQHAAISLTFLSDYKQLASYALGAMQISKNQLPVLSMDIQSINTSSKNKVQLVSSVQKATADLQTVTKELSQLKPVYGFKQLNSTMLSDLTKVSNSLRSLAGSLNQNNIASSSVSNIQLSFNNFSNLLNSSPQIINSQVSTLKIQEPL